MEKHDILKEINNIVCDILGDEEIVLSFSTTTDDIEGWDSLNHIQIISEIQHKFNIKFSALEMISWDNVGDLCDSIFIKL